MKGYFLALKQRADVIRNMKQGGKGAPQKGLMSSKHVFLKRGFISVDEIAGIINRDFPKFLSSDFTNSSDLMCRNVSAIKIIDSHSTIPLYEQGSYVD